MGALLCAFLFLCHLFAGATQYTVGIDPAFYPLELKGQEKRVYGFSMELLKEVALHEHVTIGVLKSDWFDLLSDLGWRKFQAVLCSLRPHLYYLKQYSFSSIYLQTGPVLVLQKGAPWTSLAQMQGKVIGILRGSSYATLLEKLPNLLIRMYDSHPQALNAVRKGVIDGTILPLLLAQKYIADLNPHALKILLPPLQDEGLRLVTLHGAAPHLISSFDRALADLKESGRYGQLLAKWKLNE